jgi:hypothetical protein
MPAGLSILVAAAPRFPLSGLRTFAAGREGTCEEAELS